MLMALLAGLGCGFVGSIPIAGPTAVVIVERGLNGQAWAGFEIAVGAAIAECAYALLAFLGMTAFLRGFPWLLPASRVLGAIILMGLGLYLALAPRKPLPDATLPPSKRTIGAMLLLGLVMTGVNPTLLASWSAVVTVLHSTGTLRIAPLDAFPFALGVGAGSTGWFAVMLALLHHHHRRLRQATLDKIVRGIGWVLLAVGLGLSVDLVRVWLT